jgi:hypothetical protein
MRRILRKIKKQNLGDTTTLINLMLLKELKMKA